METKSEWLTLNEDLIMVIYSYLSVEALLLLRLVSRQTQNESYAYFNNLYRKSNTIVEDYLDKKQEKLAIRERQYLCEGLGDAPDYFLTEDPGNLLLRVKQWVAKNTVFQQFMSDAYNQYQNCPIVDTPELPDHSHDLSPIGYDTIYLLEVEDDALHCYAKSIGALKVASEDCKGLPSAPLTAEMKAKIQQAFGLHALLNIIDIQALRCYMHLFNDKLFQYCYFNGKIKFETIRHGLHTKQLDYLYQVPTFLPSLERYSMELGDFNVTSEPVKQWILKHPKAKGFVYTQVELNILEDIRFLALIGQGYASLEEALLHGDNLLQAMKTIQMPPQELLPKMGKRELMTFFCEGLSNDTQKVLKGQAIVKLYEYVITRNIEEKDSIFGQASNFFKSFSGCDIESKVNAATTLIYALFGEKSLSDQDIKVLTQQGLFSEKDDRLTVIVRTMVLEPLGLASLEVFKNSVTELGLTSM